MKIDSDKLMEWIDEELELFSDDHPDDLIAKGMATALRRLTGAIQSGELEASKAPPKLYAKAPIGVDVASYIQTFVVCVIGAFGSQAISLIFGGSFDASMAADISFGAALALGLHWFLSRGEK